MRLARWIYNHLGTDFCGSPGAPGNEECIYWDAENWKPIDRGSRDHPYYVARIGNDGFELWIGTGAYWDFFMPIKQARRLAWWLLWMRIRWEWFGLRRWLWYQALHRIVKAKRGGAE